MNETQITKTWIYSGIALMILGFGVSIIADFNKVIILNSLGPVMFVAGFFVAFMGMMREIE